MTMSKDPRTTVEDQELSRRFKTSSVDVVLLQTVTIGNQDDVLSEALVPENGKTIQPSVLRLGTESEYRALL